MSDKEGRNGDEDDGRDEAINEINVAGYVVNE